MIVIADCINDAALAEAAVRQIETAYETAQSGGQEQGAAYYQMQAHAVARRSASQNFKGVIALNVWSAPVIDNGRLAVEAYLP